MILELKAYVWESFNNLISRPNAATNSVWVTEEINAALKCRSGLHVVDVNNSLKYFDNKVVSLLDTKAIGDSLEVAKMQNNFGVTLLSLSA
jgi:TolB-like protein